MDQITIIELVAAALGGISLFPQLLKVLKTKSTKDSSLGFGAANFMLDDPSFICDRYQIVQLYGW